MQKILSSRFLPFLVAAAFAAVFATALFHQISAFRTAQKEAAQEEASLLREKARLTQLQHLKEQAPLFREQLAAAERLLPSSPEEGPLIEEINAAAARAGARAVQIRFEKRVPSTGVTEMPLKLVFEGDYTELLTLLGELQGCPRALRVDGLKISKAAQGQPVLKAEISASAFYRGSGSTTSGK